MTNQEKLTITAEPRTVMGKGVNSLRGQGLIPAVLYGHDVKPVNLSVKRQQFEKVYREAGESTIIKLKVGDAKPETNVLIHDVQFHGTKDSVLHVDFYAVKMTEKLTATVPLEFTGTAPAVKQLGGTLVYNMSEVEVESLPGDLPREIEVDVSALKSFNDVLRVKDLQVDRSKVEILVDDPAQIIASVEEPRSEEELAELETAPTEVDVKEVEGVEKEPLEPGQEGEDDKEDKGKDKDKE